MTVDRKQQGINANDSAKVDIAQVVQHFAPPESRDRTEAKLLDAVKNEVSGRLAQSLHQRVYVELDKTEDSTQVVPPWSLDVKLGNASSQPCPEGTHIVEIFNREEIGGRLLILGAPGSGKTTMLLQLAEELVKRGEENAAYPVPVLLNLSAWKSEFRDIPSWMVSDLKLKYGVRKDIAEKWIEEGRILPLLDGLDELLSQRQETCVQALNEFLPTWSGTPLVVCSRLEEYQLYETNLGLSGAIILQPLTDRQIETYLRRAKCDWLWDVVRNDADVMNADRGLARSPLFLTLLVLSSDNLPVELWTQQENVTERRRILFEAYIEARLQRAYRGGANLPATKQGRKPYQNDEKTKYWLGWLGAKLIEENKTEFFIEKLQPRFLKSLYQDLFYRLVFWGTVGISFGVIFGAAGEMMFGLYVGLSLGLGSELFGIHKNIKSVESIKIDWHNVTQHFSGNIRSSDFSVSGVTLVSFLKMWLILWLIILLAAFFNAGFYGLVSALGFGVFVGAELVLFLILCMTKYLFRRLFPGLLRLLSGVEINIDINTTTNENQGIYKSFFHSFFIGLGLFGIFLTTAFFLLFLPDEFNLIAVWILVVFFIFIFIFFLLGVYTGGLNSVCQHIALRITLWLFGYSPWNYRRFLRYCTERGFLQRVGGGYRFVHALLQEHFAKEYGD
ncbi:NACHT domain-containing protein [Baaleninema sp.]|uniref:NACHT domain-containing protein n=1 Tax=Baaleninema sp. TaxID=3101197 RepID=UPI003D07B068